jgi:hypothetical protein
MLERLLARVVAVFQDNPNIPGAGRASLRDEAPKETERPSGRCADEKKVTSEILRSGHYLVLPFWVPRSGVVEYQVYADRPVSTYVFDPAGLRRFERDPEDVLAYGGFSQQLEHIQSLELPFQGDWYLVIENSGEWQARVNYEVWY